MFARRPTLNSTDGLAAFTSPAFSGDTSSPQAAQTLDTERRAAPAPVKRAARKKRT